MKFVVCISRENCGDLSTDDLTLGRLYELLAPADSHGMIRVIDDQWRGLPVSRRIVRGRRGARTNGLAPACVVGGVKTIR